MELHKAVINGIVAVLLMCSPAMNAQHSTQTCLDYRGHRVTVGQVYKPFEDQPCMDCLCREQVRMQGDSSSCLTAPCPDPPCKRYELIKGECCGFRCLEDDEVNVPLPLLGGGNGSFPWCRDFEDGLVGLGDHYKPSFDSPCVTCECEATPREPDDYSGCVTAACEAPPCKNFDPKPGKCCDYICLDQEDRGDLDRQMTGQQPEGDNLQVEPEGLRSLANQLEPCCEAGRKWYEENREQCPVYTREMAGGSREETERCKSIANVCCVEEKQSRGCGRGKSQALVQGRCGFYHTQRHREMARKCCDCCLLGLKAASLGVSCGLLDRGFSSHCSATFSECCNGAVPPTTPTTTSTNTPQFTDRCDINNPCDHMCIDTGIAIECKCFDGYYLRGDGFTCEDVDECALTTHDCQARQTCANTEGSFTCLGPVAPPNGQLTPGIEEDCEIGYAYNRVTERCEDIDECTINLYTCQSDEECINNEGSYVCRRRQQDLQCGRGFYYNTDIRSCSDIDECLAKSHSCSGGDQACRNTIGSYVCTCTEGFVYNRRSRDCEDINECALNYDNCLVGQTCVNSVGSYSCRRTMSCGTGYTLDEDSQRCLDIDECALNTHNCGPGYDCHNIQGSFRCVTKRCPQGYRLNVVTGECEVVVCTRGMRADGAGNCVDVNECTERSPCLPNQECRNTVGSYVCRDLLQCANGFELNSRRSSCVDIDECRRGLHDCVGARMQCVNTPGSYFCECPDGYQLDDFLKRCQDIDECNSQFGGRVCDLNARCHNVIGSFRCVCNEGFQQEGKLCRDVNECDLAGMCQHTCRNTMGSFECNCFEGYQLAGDRRTCEDIDECAVWAARGGQLCLGVCRNTLGSYECECPHGYRMDSNGRSCQDIDECAEGSAGCNLRDDQCINTRGGYKCETITCPKGFVKAPSLSNRNNAIRCQRQTFVCPQGDTECLYAPLSLSYNFITFPQNIRIPADLFTMRGPRSFHRRLEFNLTLESSFDPGTGESRVDPSYFTLLKTDAHEALVRLDREIQAPQDVQLKLDMNIYSREFGDDDDDEEIFFGTAIAIIKIYVTGDY